MPRLKDNKQRIGQVFKHNAQQGLIVWTFWVYYRENPILFAASRFVCKTPFKEYRYQSHQEMVEGYQKLVNGFGEFGGPYTEIEPLMSKEDIWDEIQRLKAEDQRAIEYMRKHR